MVTPMGLARSQREIGQEGLDLLGGKCQHLPPGQTGLETTEEAERESAHVDYPMCPNYSIGDAGRPTCPLADF